MSYDRVVRRRTPRRRTTARAARCGRWAPRCTWRATKASGCWRARCSSAALPAATELGPRGTALTMLGLDELPDRRRPEVAPAADPAAHAGASGSAAAIASTRPGLALVRADADLRQRAPAARALFARTRSRPTGQSLRVARETLEFLEEVCFRATGWCWSATPAGIAAAGRKSDADEQPIDAAAFVLAFRGAYLVTGDHHYLRRMREAFAWFLGANRLGVSVYDSATAGCRDGLGVTVPNLNQGAESTIVFPAVAARDAGAGRRRARIRRTTPRRVDDITMLTRTTHRLRPRPRRVIAKPYLPGEEIAPGGAAARRAADARVLAIPEAEVAAHAGAGAARSSQARHRDFEELLERHFELVAHHARRAPRCRGERRLLIGAYFTHEYSVEAAALFNPSIVPAPDQTRDGAAGERALRDEPARGRRGAHLVDRVPHRRDRRRQRGDLRSARDGTW